MALGNVPTPISEFLPDCREDVYPGHLTELFWGVHRRLDRVRRYVDFFSEECEQESLSLRGLLTLFMRQLGSVSVYLGIRVGF